jgi:general secretion pathway protein A
MLIIDEAQNLEPATLEEIRLLSNFETPTEKLLQILLVGQPELQARLGRPGLRQRRQRIAIRCTIPPLAPSETRDYIRNRLRVGGASDLGVFSEGAIRRIAGYSRGIPRVINIVCDHCLLIGFADQRRHIDAAITDEAIRYLEGGKRSRRRVRLSPLFTFARALRELFAR